MTCATPAPLPVMPASIFASATAQSIGASIPRTGAGSLGGMGTRATSTLRHGRRESDTIHIEREEERRVGKEGVSRCRSSGSPSHEIKKKNNQQKQKKK